MNRLTLPELLSDPVRARIYIEVLLKKELTAEQLMGTIEISRSTMSHHLSRFVEERVLRVRVGTEKYTRSIKFYSINPDYEEELIVEAIQDPDGAKRKAFLESSAAHLQVVSNLMLERVKQPKKKGAVTFTFSFLSEEEAQIWMEEYQRFTNQVQTRIAKIRKNASESSYSYISFGGIIPTG